MCPNYTFIVQSAEDAALCVKDWWKSADRRKMDCSETQGIPHKASTRKNTGLQDEKPETVSLNIGTNGHYEQKPLKANII